MDLLEIGGDMLSRKCFTSIVVPVAMLSVAAAATQSRKAQDSPDQKESYNYVLTMDKVQKLANATKDLTELFARHPEMQTFSSYYNLDQITQQFQKYPEAVAILKKNSLTPREYVVAKGTLMQASMAVRLKKDGTYKEYPPEILKDVSPANLAFVEKHFDEVHKVLRGSSSSHK
jgi:hypothetical protein